MLDIRTIVELLSDSYTDEGIDIWLHSRNRNLDMRRPIDLLIEGQVDQVLEEAKWVAGGMSHRSALGGRTAGSRVGRGVVRTALRSEKAGEG